MAFVFTSCPYRLGRNGNLILPGIQPIQCQFAASSVATTQIIADTIMLLLLSHSERLQRSTNDGNVSRFHFERLRPLVVSQHWRRVQKKQQIEKNKDKNEGKANLDLIGRSLCRNRDSPIWWRNPPPPQIDKPSLATSICERISFLFPSKAA